MAALPFFALALTVIQLVLLPVHAFNESAYEKNMQLDDDVTLYWSKLSILGVDSIRFALKGKTAGYVALGISEAGNMIGSDMMIGSVAGGKAMVIDAFSFNKSVADTRSVVIDDKQDVQTIAGEEYVDDSGETYTVIEFVRVLDTGDCNDRPIVPGYNEVIWALGSTDALAYHGLRFGHKQFAFFGDGVDAPRQTTVAPGAEILNITAPAINVPTDFTYYACNTYNLTEMVAEKRHIMQYVPTINTNAPETVHHLVIHHCNENETRALGTEANRECSAGPGCMGVLAVWAVGAQSISLPDFLGLPIGPGTGAEIVVMQIHYTNPAGRTDIWDRSGLQLVLSPELRPVEGGILPTGPYFYTGLVRIPPQQPAWTMVSTCTPDCTAYAIKDNITIISSGPHMHLLGSRLFTKVYRDGEEVDTISHMDYFDFNRQTQIMLPKPVTVKAGDSIQTTCVWNSMSRNETTRGGPSTMEEMCMDYMIYYPLRKQFMGGCWDACSNPNLITRSGNGTLTGFDRTRFLTAFQPEFSDKGFTFEACSTNKFLVKVLEQCSYEEKNGRPTDIPYRHGCPNKTLAALPQSEVDRLQVTAVQSSPEPAVGCSWTMNGATVTFESCSSVPGGFQLNWRRSSPSTVTFGFSGNQSGWISLGRSESGQMVGSNAVIGGMVGGSMVVKSYFLGGKSSAQVQSPGKWDVTDLQGEAVGKELRMMFTLATNAANVKTLDNNNNASPGSLGIIWAKGPTNNNPANGQAGEQLVLSGHASEDAYAGSLDLRSVATGGGSPSGRGPSSAVVVKKRDNLRSIHGVVNAVSWGLLIPLGALLARHGKALDPLWFYAHMAIQSSGLLLGVAGFVIGVILQGRTPTHSVLHFSLAVIIITLSGLQMLALVVKPKKDSSSRSMWNMFHHNGGRLVILFSIANIFVGLNLLQPSRQWWILYCVLLGLLVMLAVALEVRLSSVRLWTGLRLRLPGRKQIGDQKMVGGSLPAREVFQPEITSP